MATGVPADITGFPVRTALIDGLNPAITDPRVPSYTKGVGYQPGPGSIDPNLARESILSAPAVGDINGDGLMDIVGAYGWWEHPKDNGPETVWKYHPEPFGRWGRESAGGATIAVYDVNGDGLNDVVTSLQAHGSGIVWFEQKRTKAGEISFVPHTVMGDSAANSAGGVYFTEPHGSTVADVDGDGIPDFIIGKRYWSHLDDYYDPDPYGTEVLYWYKTVRDPKAPGGARLVPELIHNRSGVGSDVLACDLNGDGVVDIVTSARSGTYIFWGTRAKQGQVEKQPGH